MAINTYAPDPYAFPFELDLRTYPGPEPVQGRWHVVNGTAYLDERAAEELARRGALVEHRRSGARMSLELARAEMDHQMLQMASLPPLVLDSDKLALAPKPAPKNDLLLLLINP